MAGNFCEHEFSLITGKHASACNKNIGIFDFATIVRSHDLCSHLLQFHAWKWRPCQGISVYFNFETIVRGYHAYESA